MASTAEGRRIVLVVETDEQSGIATVALVSNVTEAATDRDVLLPPSESNLPYAAVIEADVVGPVWYEQLVDSLGMVPDALARAIVRTANSQYNELPASARGVPLQGDDDWRAKFKQAEVQALQALNADCVGFLFGHRAPAACDPHFLRPDRATDEDCEALFGWVAQRSVTVGPLMTWELLQDPDYASQWLERFGWDGWQAIQLLLQPKVSRVEPSVQEGQNSITPEPRDPRDLELLLLEGRDRVQRGEYSMVLATRDELWARTRPFKPFCSARIGDAQVHIVRDFVEA